MPEREGQAIKDVLTGSLPSLWDGKECILYLKKHSYNWRQMEWIGWFFEFAARRMLIKKLGGKEGPRFGRTTMDYEHNFVWDFKAHPSKLSGRDEAILNDCEAVDSCIAHKGGLGFVIAVGQAVYDETGEFKKWHDELKGRISSYEKERVARGAKSRRRKKAFKLKGYEILFLSTREHLERALREGWLSDNAQIGWRNADGSPRRAKYKIQIDRNTGLVQAVTDGEIRDK